jgi:hypothetical protein
VEQRDAEHSGSVFAIGGRALDGPFAGGDSGGDSGALRPPERAEPAESEAESLAAEAARAKARRKDLVTRLWTAAVLIPYVLWVVAHGGLA